MVKKTDKKSDTFRLGLLVLGGEGWGGGGGQRPQGAAVEMLTNTETFAFGNEFLGFGPAL